MIIIGDITKAFAGSESGLLKQLSEYLAGKEQIAVRIACHTTQAQFVASEFPQFSTFRVQPGSNPTAIAETIWEIGIEPTLSIPDLVEIYSFHPTVLTLSQRVAFEARRRYKFAPWKSLRPNPSGTVPASSVIGIPLSQEQIHDALLKVLSRHPHGVRTTDLRGFLAHENPIFEKTPGTISAMPGFISNIVRGAKIAGLIELDSSRDMQNPLILAKRTFVTLPIVTPSAPIISGPIKQAEQPKTKIRTRSQHLSDILKQHNLGPFSSTRTQLYDTVERLALEGKLTANSLIRTAVSETRKCVTVDEKYPWWLVEKFVFILMGLHRVLLGPSDEQLDPNALESLGVTVSKMKADWREILDAEMIFFLIRQDANVAAFDIPDLAGLLYGDRSTEIQLHVERLLKRLEGDGRIATNQRGVFIIKSVTST